MEYNGKIDIAIGMKANSRKWKNESWDWSDMVDKLTTEYKTNETYEQFMNSSKDEQSRIKDAGGYVGGYLRGGRRKPANVVHRQLLTLDIDFAHLDFWDDFLFEFDNAAVLHGTHKHSDDTPRYRLVMPLDREVSPDEYVALGRQIAGIIGIEMFDNTTFETNRLMFWPSNPIDVDYYSEAHDAPWLEVDKYLGMYKNWKDSSLWPTSMKKLKEVINASKKQEEPEAKKGLVGIFCRAYPISEAIGTFLSDSYRGGSDGRYTYVNGSTSKGLVCYEDKFVYSHHGTDPCGGKLCNSFDLVRIHKYGHLDTQEKEDNTNSKSFKSMLDLVRGDRAVKELIAKEKMQSVNYDFAEPLEEYDEEIQEEDLKWASKLDIDPQGKYIATAANISAILANDSRLKGKFILNEFDTKKYVVGDMPWRAVPKPEPVRNVDFAGLRNYIERVYGIAASFKIDDALALEFEKASYHPIRDYLNSLKWDGTPRVDDLLIDYLGANDNLYAREAIRKMMVAAVARAFRPGTKFDLVLTFVGEQGIGKSTFVKKLGKEWFSDTFMTVHGKEALEQIQGAWIIEMAELSGLRKAEVESVKHFISKQEDTYRPAYGKIVETHPRQCVFVATTNNKMFLKDPSGNRRFLPIDTNAANVSKDLFSPEFDAIIDQLWAEAMMYYKRGEKLFLSEKAEDYAKIEQRGHSETDDRAGMIEAYLDTLLPGDWDNFNIPERRDYLRDPLSPNGVMERHMFCAVEVWCECLGKEKEDMDRYKSRDLYDVLRTFEDWEYTTSTRNFGSYGKQKHFRRKLT